jgi:hypothetical protein
MPVYQENDPRDKAPFLSFYRRRPRGADIAIDPIRKGHVLFYKEACNHSDLSRDSNIIKTNLKWEGDNTPFIASFLRQICLMSIAEAFASGARTFDFFYSLPTAFTSAKVEQFISIWQQCSQWLKELGFDCKQAEGQTEAVAAAAYFAKKTGPAFADTAVFIDIGGGTSDVSVWTNGAVKHQVSVRLSGHELFLEPLRQQRHELVEPLFRGMLAEEAYSRLVQSDGQLFYAYTDAALRQYESRIMPNLAIFPTSDGFSVLQTCIAAGLGGLLFYIGNLLKALRAGGFAGDVPIDCEHLPALHVGGNASKMLHWIANGNFTSASVAGVFLKDIFEYASGLSTDAESFRIYLSKDPKAEAAYGLVSRVFSPLALMTSKGYPVLAGEAFEARGQAVPASAVLRSQDLVDGIAFRTSSALGEFITLYNDLVSNGMVPDACIKLPDSKMAMQMVKEGILNYALRQRGLDLKSVELEPLFIVGLRVLIGYFARHGGSD